MRDYEEHPLKMEDDFDDLDDDLNEGRSDMDVCFSMMEVMMGLSH
jgi:hypothetical protein